MSSISIDDTIGLAGDIYEAAHGQAEWKSTLSRIADAFGGSRACFQKFDTRATPGDHTASVEEEDNLIDVLIGGGYPKVTPLTKALLNLPDGATYAESALIDVKSWRKSPVWNDLMAPRDMYGGIGYRVPDVKNGDWWIFDVNRGRCRPDFDDSDVKVIELLKPALARAVRIGLRRKLERLDGGAETIAFDQLPVGIVVVSSELKVLRANHLAEILMERHGLRIAHGAMLTGEIATTRQLLRIVSKVCRIVGDMPGAGDDILLRRFEQPNMELVLSVVPLFTGRWTGPSRKATAAIYMRELAADPGPGFAARVASIFGLTPREGEVAAKLAEGLSLKEIAEIKGIGIVTIRTHLASLFRKTGTSRQSQLVATLVKLSDLRQLD